MTASRDIPPPPPPYGGGGGDPMPLSLPEFLCQMAASPALTLTVLLTLAVLLVNGWTDAPNAIAAAVVTGALSFPSGGVRLAAVCNFLGVLFVTAVQRLGGRDHLLHRLFRRRSPRRPSPPCAPPWLPSYSGRPRPGASASPPARATPW